MIFGPNMQNFAEIARSFLANDGAVQVQDAAGLEKALSDLLADKARCADLGRNALKVVHENQGAVGRTTDMILRHLDSEVLYIAPPK
jgi:3-deoxy-D-manno-octulosonic-acid transferase